MLLAGMFWREIEKKSNFFKSFFLATLLFLPLQIPFPLHAVFPLSVITWSTIVTSAVLLFPPLVAYLISSVLSSVSFPCFSTFPFCSEVELLVLPVASFYSFNMVLSLSLPLFFSTPFLCHFLSSPLPLRLSPSSFFTYFSRLSHPLQTNLSIFKPGFLLFFL